MSDDAGYYDREGKQILFLEWLRLCSDPEQRTHRLRFASVGGKIVSTVWTGVDAANSDPPLIFETLVFDRDEWNAQAKPLKPTAERRYATEEEAIAGHGEIVAEIRAEAMNQDVLS